MFTYLGRAQELCESRGGRPELPVRNSPDGLCGRKATLNLREGEREGGRGESVFWPQALELEGRREREGGRKGRVSLLTTGTLDSHWPQALPTWSARGGEQKAKCDQSVVCVARNHQSCRRIAQLAQPLCPSLSAAKEREEVVSRHTGQRTRWLTLHVAITFLWQRRRGGWGRMGEIY